jgi:SOS-response transcriptional repressor LexA
MFYMDNDNRTLEKVYTFVRDYITQQGYSPTLQEVADAVGCTQRNVAYHLEQLRRMGLIDRRRRKTRGISLVNS